MQLHMHYQTLSCFIPCNDNHVSIYGNCRFALLVAALIGQTPVLIHAYLLISLLFLVVLLVTFLFRSYKLILLINIYQSRCHCILQNQLRISMFIQPISVNLHIFLMWHKYYYNIHFVNPFVTVLFNSPHIFDQIHQPAQTRR